MSKTELLPSEPVVLPLLPLRDVVVFPHMVIFPCVAISSLILGFNLMADGLREISLRD